eukprot:3457762-Rhodomonas_salina.1
MRLPDLNTAQHDAAGGILSHSARSEHRRTAGGGERRARRGSESVGHGERASGGEAVGRAQEAGVGSGAVVGREAGGQRRGLHDSARVGVGGGAVLLLRPQDAGAQRSMESSTPAPSAPMSGASAVSACGGKVVSGGKEAKDSVRTKTAALIRCPRLWLRPLRSFCWTEIAMAGACSKEQAQGPAENNTGGAAQVWFSSDGLAIGSRNLSGPLLAHRSPRLTFVGSSRIVLRG